MSEETGVKETKSDERRAANYFWTLLGKPDEFNNEETGNDWTIKMRDCMGEAELDLAGFKRFLEWTLEENPMSAKYLRIAGNPIASLAKNMGTLLRIYKAHLKGQEVLAKNQSKLKKQGKNDDRPEYLKESGKQGYLEKTDL